MQVSPGPHGLATLLVVFYMLPCMHSSKSYFFAMSPTNTIASLDTDAEFNCNTKDELDTLDLKTKTIWSKYNNKGMFQYGISEDGKVLSKKYYKKYRATNSTNLIIKNVAFSDAGLYACEQDNPHYKRMILFMVKESEPACAYEYMDYVDAGDSMLMHCFFTYSADNLEYAPFARFQTGTGRALETKVTKTIVLQPSVYEMVASSKYTVSPAEHGKSVKFYFGFESQPIQRQLQVSSYTQKAEEPPLWSYEWIPDPMNVTYWAIEPTMSPEKVAIKIGETITCDSSANPGPVQYEIKIFPENGDSYTINKNYFKVEDSHQGSLKLLCSASSLYKGERKTRKKDFQIYVIPESGKFSPGAIGGIVSGTILGVGCIVLAGMIVIKKAKSHDDGDWLGKWQKEKEKEEKKAKKEEKQRTKSLEKAAKEERERSKSEEAPTKLRKTSSVI